MRTQNVPRAKDGDARARTSKRLAFAVRRREALIDILAPDGECAECGNHFPASKLVVDHVNGIEWNHTRLSPQMRAAKYWREHGAGVPLRALCQPCSGRDGQRRMGRRRYG